MLAKELVDHGVVVETALNLVLNHRVLDFFVLLDNILNLFDDALKSPLSEVCRHLHAFLLALEFSFLNLKVKVAHLKHGCTTLGEAIEHFLREVSIDSVLLEDGDFLDSVGHLVKDAFDKNRNFFLFEVATEDLQGGSCVAIRYLHAAQ